MTNADCPAHQWIVSEIQTSKDWREKHMCDHKDMECKVDKIDRSLFKWSVAMFSIQAFVGALAAAALWGKKMGLI